MYYNRQNPDFCPLKSWFYGLPYHLSHHWEAIVSILPNESYGKKFQNTTLPDCKIYGMSRYRLLRSRLSKNHKPLISCFVNIWFYYMRNSWKRPIWTFSTVSSVTQNSLALRYAILFAVSHNFGLLIDTPTYGHIKLKGKNPFGDSCLFKHCSFD